MRKTFVWCKIFAKRQLKRPSMIFVLVLMLLMSTALRLMSMDITAGAEVGFYINEASEYYDEMKSLSDSLAAHDGMIKFLPYTSVEAMERDVRSDTLQCAYSFSDDFFESIMNGKNKKVIELIEAPENAVSLLSNVVVLATVMENMANHMLVADVEAQDFFSGITDADLDTLRETYLLYASNGSTFSFDYNALYEEYSGSSRTFNISAYLVTPVKGIVAIFVFIIALTGGVSWYKDNGSAAYANIPLNKRPAIKLLVITIPVSMAAIAGYISLLIAGVSDDPAHELYVMIVYSLICIAFTYVLTAIVNENFFSALIPVFILGSVVCCPIFFNLANIIPAMKVLQNIFVPSVYFML